MVNRFAILIASIALLCCKPHSMVQSLEKGEMVLAYYLHKENAWTKNTTPIGISCDKSSYRVYYLYNLENNKTHFKSYIIMREYKILKKLNKVVIHTYHTYGKYFRSDTIESKGFNRTQDTLVESFHGHKSFYCKTDSTYYLPKYNLTLNAYDLCSNTDEKMHLKLWHPSLFYLISHRDIDKLNFTFLEGDSLQLSKLNSYWGKW